MAMNPGMKIVAHQEKVCSETETLFSDAFYASLDGVCTALDNVQARLYMDSRCVFYQLPMLESGTLGTKGNTQIVVPGVTENYGATRDPPEKGFPVCTVKNFPNVIQHTLQWANEIFEGTFRLSAENVNQYLTTPNFREMLNSQQNTKLDTLKSVKETLVDDRPRSFEDCVVWARLYFERLFNNDIRQLLHNLPEDKLTTAGTPFWGGSKRCPKPLQFDMNAVCEDAEMRNHYDFIVAAANLRAKMYGIKGRTEEEYFQQFLPEIIIPDFTPKQGVKIQTKEDEKEEEAPPADMDVDSECDKIFAELPAPSSLAGFRLELIEFDKDIDEHMLFVTACSNLRAINYQIPTEDTHKSRAIAGRIIPAIATTTALVTGLICLEMYKVVGSANKELPIEAYKNSFLNLAIPFMTSTEPQGPAKTKAMLKGKEWEWSAWDSIHMNIGDITLKEFMEYFEKEYNLEINMLSYGVSLLYSFFANKKKVAERMTMSMTEIIKDVTKKEFAEHQLYVILEVVVNDIETGDEVELPYIKFQFKEAPH
uniref:Ubiquitin-activating enzyme E1 C-terminal domain-containing protein n=1 Tax=Corethron hystrix TaxID=216773 RepID=A0A7S1BIN6_9STRA